MKTQFRNRNNTPELVLGAVLAFAGCGNDAPRASSEPASDTVAPRAFVTGEFGGPVVDYGALNDTLDGTACTDGQEHPEIIEELALTAPKVSRFGLLIPKDLCTVRCVLLRVDIGDDQIKDHVMPADEVAMRELSARHACAVLTAWFEWPYHNAQSRKSGPATEAALASLAKKTAHPELTTAPIAVMGFGSDAGQFASSLAASYPKRVAAVATWPNGSGISNQVPGLYFAGGAGMNGALPAWYETHFKPKRMEGAPIGFAIDPLVANNWGNTKKIGYRFLDRVLPLRLAKGAEASKGELVAIDVSSAGWIGDNTTHSVQQANGSAPSGDSSWLPTEEFATLWSGFFAKGEVAPGDSDYPAASPLMEAIPEPTLPQGKGLTEDAPYGTRTQGDAQGVPSMPPPPLAPKLLLSTYIGGLGDQFVREVSFGSDGKIMAQGNGFAITYDPNMNAGSVTGDVATNDTNAFGTRTSPVGPPGNELTDSRNGQTYSVGYRQTGATEQTPFLRSSADWKLWDHDDPIGDQRGMDVWLMPNGMIGFRGDSLAAHAGVLGLDPRDRSLPLPGSVMAGAWQSEASTSGSAVFLIDPAKRNVVSGTWMDAFTGFQAVDHWGRLYIANAVSSKSRFDADNPFRMTVGPQLGGFFVLDSSLRKAMFNASMGGTCAKADGIQAIRQLAVRKNLLVLGGTTCATDLVTTPNAVQKTPGGGQDGVLFVVELWR